MRFSCFGISSGSAEALVRRGEKVKHLLTSRFRTAKIYQHRFTYFKVIARQTIDIF